MHEHLTPNAIVLRSTPPPPPSFGLAGAAAIPAGVRRAPVWSAPGID